MKLAPVKAQARKGALASLAAAVLLATPQLGDPGAAARAAPKKEQPNILIFVTDDQRMGEGSMEVMPRTRAIGREGIVFREGYVTNPLCCPSRATIMTGRYSHNHGVTNNDNAELLDQTTTMQAKLHSAGYNTSIFGKFFNGLGWNTPLFFDRWFVQRRKTDYKRVRFNDQGLIKRFPGYVTDTVKSASVHHLESLERRDNKPWFMLIAPIAPHLPAIPAKRHVDAPVSDWAPNPAVLEDDVTDKPPWVQTRAPTDVVKMTDIRARQLRTLMAVDQMVGRIDRTLRQLDERRDTLVILTSDNGFALGEHRMYEGLWKKHPYTSSIKVPFLMRWPAELEHSNTRRLVSNVDIAPTVYDAARVKAPIEVDGRSLLDRTWQRRFLFFEHLENPEAFDDIPDWGSVLYQDHQYVEYYDDLTVSNIPTFMEYYDLDADPWQLENLLGDGDPLNDPDVVGEHLLVNRLWTCHGTSGDNPCP